MTTKTPRKKQPVQSAATHLVGTRPSPGDALCCGLAAAMAVLPSDSSFEREERERPWVGEGGSALRLWPALLACNAVMLSAPWTRFI